MLLTLITILKRSIIDFTALFFPSVCKKCYTALNKKELYLCRRCLTSLPYSRYEQFYSNPVNKTFWGRTKIEFASSIFLFRQNETVQNLIYRLKYKNDPQCGIFLGEIAGHIYINSTIFKKADIIIPVPLHPSKEKDRGYNQCAKIAQGISKVTGIPVENNLLQRVAPAHSQTSKHKYDRWLNCEESFRVNNNNEIKDKKVLLIDDVITTGATLEACCNKLNNLKNINLYILTIAYTEIE
ncbi:phosphoribosyltransferase family protein [Marinilabiliaceae bacterium ANBcel2]|nr:phosphoribosyltransferase family protein [Marinilabiliaceae bacterium ANBcel2]